MYMCIYIYNIYIFKYTKLFYMYYIFFEMLRKTWRHFNAPWKHDSYRSMTKLKQWYKLKWSAKQERMISSPCDKERCRGWWVTWSISVTVCSHRGLDEEPVQMQRTLLLCVDFTHTRSLKAAQLCVKTAVLATFLPISSMLLKLHLVLAGGGNHVDCANQINESRIWK